VVKDLRVSLCRCGSSNNKPFCDKRHEQVGFRHDGLLGENVTETEELQQTLLKVIPFEDETFEVRAV